MPWVGALAAWSPLILSLRKEKGGDALREEEVTEEWRRGRGKVKAYWVQVISFLSM